MISLGANLGDTLATMQTAERLLVECFGASRVGFASLLATPAIGGPPGQSEFLNSVARIQTDGDVFELWHQLRQIESLLGRERRTRWESRRIDLDILLFNDLRIWTPQLKVPHPRMVTRSFAILPAAELSPQWIEPVTGQNLQTLANRLPYKFEPATGLLELLPASSFEGPRRIVVIGETRMSKRLKEAWLDSSNGIFEVELIASESDFLPTPKTLAAIDAELTKQPVTLLVVAVDCPDPLNVAWEDYSRDWAIALALSEPGLSQWSLPVYLLNASDIPWAIHELSAAVSAMQCDMKTQPRRQFRK